jgi:hypothetical protein
MTSAISLSNAAASDASSLCGTPADGFLPFAFFTERLYWATAGANGHLFHNQSLML